MSFERQQKEQELIQTWVFVFSRASFAFVSVCFQELAWAFLGFPQAAGLFGLAGHCGAEP